MMTCSAILLFLILLISSFGQSIVSASTSTISERAYAVELNGTNFDAVLNETPAPYAIVQFYAHWCPACRNYKPHYEKVARLFNGADAIHPGIILMARVDCALKMNSNICDNFSVVHFPVLFWGPSKKFIGGSWAPKQENSELHPIENRRTADILLSWINKQLLSSYGFDDGKYENENLQINTSDPGQVTSQPLGIPYPSRIRDALWTRLSLSFTSIKKPAMKILHEYWPY